LFLYRTDENGKIEKYENGNDIFTQYSLTTNTSTDEDAYNDAMNKYNYAQYQYDQRVQEINSKIEVVQQQDKSLELELKQLDTEENAISTEMEAVKKVISKNVESSFKTFNA
jgi:predicted RNase H-like nuclease (RuvC/YqgF family)